MKPDKFIAIDFETANRNMASACAIGIVVFQEGVLTYKESFLIRPHESVYSFDPSFIDIHHIHPEDVADQREFNELWPLIREIFKDGILVAHNASFDMTVLMSLITLYKLEYDHFSYFCTVKMSRSAFKFLPSHRLNVVAQHLGIALDHHDAGSDAFACAQIVNQTMILTGIYHPWELCDALMVPISSSWYL